MIQGIKPRFIMVMCWGKQGLPCARVVWEGFLEEVHKGQVDPRRREGAAGSMGKGRRRESRPSRLRGLPVKQGWGWKSGANYWLGTMTWPEHPRGPPCLC